jgi:uncharacterized membrane protein
MTFSAPAALAFGFGLGFGLMFGVLAIMALADVVRDIQKRRRAEKSA